MTNILIIFDHDEDTSFCLYAAIATCLTKSSTISIRLKNICSSFDIEKTLWFKDLKEEYKARINTYNGVTTDRDTHIVCSLTPKTPLFFLNNLNVKKIGLFFNKKIITNDYSSPFLLMRNTPNKLNRETIYSLILNGFPPITNYDLKNRAPKYINNPTKINESVFKMDTIRIQCDVEKSIESLCTHGKDIKIITNNKTYVTKKRGDFTFLATEEENILEEIVHLSHIYSLFNSDYKIPDSEVSKETLDIFLQAIENIFEVFSYLEKFSRIGDLQKTNEAFDVCNQILNKYKVFISLSEYFHTLNQTTDAEVGSDIYFDQVANNCETMQMVCKTIYHLASQKQPERRNSLKENN